MSKMNEMYIKMMEEHYNSLSEEEANHLKAMFALDIQSSAEEYKYWEQKGDISS